MSETACTIPVMAAEPGDMPPTEVEETGLFLDGLRCASCVGRVERVLREAPGVVQADVNFTSHRALVRFDASRTSAEALADAVRALGYTATPYDPVRLDRPAAQEARSALVRLLAAAFFAGNAMMVSVALYLGVDDGSFGGVGGMDATTRTALRWLVVALSVPSITWCAAPFWRGAWSGLRRREIPLDVPVVLGITTSFCASVVGTISGTTHVFADSASMIVFLVLLGRTLERNARARAAGAVERLVAMTPERALRRTETGIEDVLASELRVGDVAVVPPGQRVPADGRVIAGETEIDESLVTGESAPVVRAVGAPVIGATRNVLAEIDVRLEAPPGAGALARIAALLERAQGERPKVQRVVDRVSRVFAPAVLIAAGITAIGWTLAGASSLDVALTAAAVLIVACPCALGLATPAAVSAAIGRGAQLGVLFKGGEALERSADVGAVLLDKTGTLTRGRLAVREIAPAAGHDAKDVIAVACEAEGSSTHPVARALRSLAEERGIAIVERPGRRAVAGQGVIAGEGSDRAVVGSRAFLQSLGCSVEGDLLRRAEAAAARGESLAFVATATERETLAALGFASLIDPVRDDASAAVRRLAGLGTRVSLVSGDHQAAVRRASAAAGISDVEAEVSPEGKVAAVETRRRSVAPAGVLFAGDGVNDAAALAGADVGIAFAEGADVTVHAADVVVTAPRLEALADVIELARSARRRMRENLAIALLYNGLAVPLAATGWLRPLPSAIAMSLSSLAVVLNAIRLLRWRARG